MTHAPIESKSLCYTQTFPGTITSTCKIDFSMVTFFFSNKFLTGFLFYFLRYHRCQFELPLNFDGGSHHSAPGGLDQLQQGIVGTSSNLTTHSGTMTPVSISSFSRWDQISEKLKPSEKPVVLNR